MKLAGRKTSEKDKIFLTNTNWVSLDNVRCTPTIKEEHLFVPKVFAEIDLKQRPYLINLQPRQKFLQKLTLNNQVELKQRPYLIKKRCNRNIYHACQNILGGQLSQILKWKTILFHIVFKDLSKVHEKELNMYGHWEEGWTSPTINRFPEGKVWGKSRGRRGCSIHPCLWQCTQPLIRPI